MTRQQAEALIRGALNEARILVEYPHRPDVQDTVRRAGVLLRRAMRHPDPEALRMDWWPL